MFYPSFFITSVYVPLVEVNYEYHIISKTCHSLHRGHFHQKSKKIINYCIQKSVHQRLIVEVRDRLKTVVDVKLGSHIDEAEGVNATNESVEKERIVAFVITICERVIGVTEN